MEWYIEDCSPGQTIGFDFPISVRDHQRALAVQICTQHLRMCTQEAEELVAGLSRSQLIHICTSVPDLGPPCTEMAQFLKPLEICERAPLVLPGGPVQVSVLCALSCYSLVCHCLKSLITVLLLMLKVFAVHAAIEQQLSCKPAADIH